ncbi:MAG: DUF4199 domain-containing protein [Bacteroidetes bacterium]|nr:DUF4199 domain-containing protein [Bacteroidota bacterium]
MKKNVLIFGSIAGIIVSAFMFVSMLMLSKDPNFEGSMLVGYTAMLVAFSFVFVGIKNFRDKYNNGFISFGKACKVGLFISLIASTMYVITWLIELNFFIPNFMELYTNHVLDHAKASGVTAAELDKQVAEMASYKEMYKNPLFVILLTYLEILPMGILVTLISALILKKKDKSQTQIA